MNKTRSVCLLAVAALLAAGCQDGDAPRTTTRTAPRATTQAAGDGAPSVRTPATSARRAAPKERKVRKKRRLGGAWAREHQDMPRAKKTFQEVLRLIRDKYVDAGLSEDQLYSGAIDGMLGRLVQAKDRKVNAMLDPDSLKEMELGLKGTLSGVGVVIKIIEEVVFVMQVLPNGPGARAGLLAGDRILAVNGERLRGKTLLQIVKLIRGPTGSKVSLFIQRDTREWTQSVVRGKLTIEAVSAKLLPDNVALIRITNFNRNTVKQLDATLARLKGARKVVLDLRACPGGLLDQSIQVADRFLPAGRTIVSVKHRDGTSEVKKATRADPGDALDVVVLTSSQTASGAEIVAAALADNGRATLVGEPTLGKGTVETILRLDNGWALKLSVARFYSPSGRSLQGEGLVPDFRIADASKGSRRYVVARDLVPKKDPQIQAAVRLLLMH